LVEDDLLELFDLDFLFVPKIIDSKVLCKGRRDVDDWKVKVCFLPFLNDSHDISTVFHQFIFQSLLDRNK
jgi:hypothetical protein